MRRLSACIAILTLSLALTSPLSALIEFSLGNAPVTDRHWPAGSLDVANLRARVGSCLLYTSDAADE